MLDNACALALLALLIAAALFDFRARLIPNRVSGAIAALWLAYVLAGAGRAVPMVDLLYASGVFLGCFLMWRLDVIGGGDVKLLSAVALWAGGPLLLPFLALTALAGGLLSVFWIACRRVRLLLPARIACGLASAGLPTLPGSRGGVPYGGAISLAGVWLSYRLFWS